MLASPPRTARLVFSDDVIAAPGSEAIRNGGGSVLDGQPRVVGGRTLVLPLGPRLADGDYTVRWSVVSDDGHREQGVIAFGVGAGRAPPVPALSAEAEVRSRDVVSRTLFLLGTLVAGGSLLLLRGGRAGAWLPVAAFVAAFAGASSLLHTVDAGGTRFALVLEVASTAALVGGGAAALVPWYPSLRFLAWASALALLATPTLSGHALDPGRPRPLAAALDLLHVAAASVWLGGLAALAFALTPARVAQAARRFSPFALGSVLVLAATGAARAVIELDSLDQAWTTGYGRALLVKTGLFGAVLVLGWVHRARLLPALERAAEAVGRLQQSVRVETLVLVAAVVAVGTLTALRPAGQAAVETAVEPPARPTAPASGALQIARQDRDLVVAVSYAPRRLTVTLIGPDGRAPGASVSVAANGRAVPTASCGPGCFQGEAPAAAMVLVRPAGYRAVAFAVPAVIPSASALLHRSELAFGRLRTVRVDELLASGLGTTSRSVQLMAAPDRFAYRLSDGTAGIVVGDRRWDRIRGGPWQQAPQEPPLRLPSPLWSPARRDARLIGPHRIAFLDPTIPAWFDVRLDPATGLPLRVRMTAAAHFMTDRYSRFDRPVVISPPR